MVTLHRDSSLDGECKGHLQAPGIEYHPEGFHIHPVSCKLGFVSMRDLRGHAGAATVREHAAAAEHDREQMPMALIQKLAKRMCNMDETEMISASLLAWAGCMCC